MRSPYLVGGRFMTADISVTYALQLARRSGCVSLGEAERAYMARTIKRDTYQRAMQTVRATRGVWLSRGPGQ